MSNRVAANTKIGVLAAIPLLLSLIALAAFVYAVSVALSMTERDDAARLAVQAQGHETASRVSASRQKGVAKRMAVVRTHVVQLRAAHQRLKTVATLGVDLEQAKAEAVKATDGLARLQEDERQVRLQLDELSQLEARVRNMRVSRKDLDAEIQELKSERLSLEKRAGGVRRAIEDKERVPANQLVPAGSRKAAAFVECDSEGALLMPERRRLSAFGQLQDRRAFLDRARTTGYVVFLIRPSGIPAFERYRTILEDYNRSAAITIDIGYEPVNADWKLVYPSSRVSM